MNHGLRGARTFLSAAALEWRGAVESMRSSSTHIAADRNVRAPGYTDTL
jgi:hypothetical protein